MAPRDWFWVVLLGAIWGCSFLFNAILIREIGPRWVSAGRVSIGAVGCWAYFIATRRKLPEGGRIYLGFLLLGIVGYVMPFALFPLAEQHDPEPIARSNDCSPFVPILEAAGSPVEPILTMAAINSGDGGRQST